MTTSTYIGKTSWGIGRMFIDHIEGVLESFCMRKGWNPEYLKIDQLRHDHEPEISCHELIRCLEDLRERYEDEINQINERWDDICYHRDGLT